MKDVYAMWHCIGGILTNGKPEGYSPAGFEDFFRQIGTSKEIPFKANKPGNCIDCGKIWDGVQMIIPVLLNRNNQDFF